MSSSGHRLCPCGTGASYAVCCEPLHDNRAQASTAVQLMRSRYSAYAVGRLDHVFRTWDPRTRPDEIRPVTGLSWTGLTILSIESGQPADDEGVVEFDAAYVTSTDSGVQHERSRFRRRSERWVYVDADEG